MSGAYVIDVDYTGPAAEQPAGMLFRMDLPGAIIWSDRPVIPLGETGCILGHVFWHAGSTAALTELHQQDVAQVVRTAGRHLLDHFWGGYVAVLRTDDGLLTVLRDPSSTLPCYYSRRGRRVTISSDARLCLDRSGLPVKIDYSAIARYLAAIGRIDNSTCISGLTELLGGECLIMTWDDHRRETWWSPWDYCAPIRGASDADLAAELRRLITRCTSCWAMAYDSILVGASGGLDSSIVATSCQNAGNPARLLNLVGPDAEGDETHYAETLAEALSQSLTYRRYQLADLAIHRAALPHLPRPQGTYFLLSTQQAQREATEVQTIDAFFTGHGGDNIFCSMRSVAPLIDRIGTPGERLSAGRTLSDLAGLTGESIWSIIGVALQSTFRRKAAIGGAVDRSGLTPSMITQTEAHTAGHPWLKPLRRAPRGKVSHVTMLASALGTLDMNPRRSGHPHIAPLLSQPIIEFCLGIPSWRWIEGGVDRAPVRAGFQGNLPRAILARRSKGGPSGFLRAFHQAEGGKLRDWLRDGLLVSNGVLDPDFLRVSDTTPWTEPVSARRMLSFGSAEAWARSWTATKTSV